jgi:DnaJ family protein A protein 2
MQKKISLKEALCGFTFDFEYINGKTYTLNNNGGNIIPPNYNKILSGMGLTRESTTGNLIVQFFIDFPEKLSDEKIQKLSEIL